MKTKDFASTPARIGWKNEANQDRGVVEISDAQGHLVWMLALSAEELKKGTKGVEWDGKYAEGVEYDDHKEADPSQMPYRVEIRAHTKEGESEGLALAARHSEVRLYCHDGLLNPVHRAYHARESKPALALEPAKHYPKPAPSSGETALYYQYKLAEAGYHPGPVNGKRDNSLDGEAVYKIALRELKRSVPRDGAAPGPATGAPSTLSATGTTDRNRIAMDAIGLGLGAT